MIRAGALNSYNYPVRTEMTGTKHIPTSHNCSTDESELKEFLVEEILSQICSTEEDESKTITAEKCSTKEDES